MCSAFSCTPDVAMVQDFRTVQAILEYRLAVSAKDQHNQDATKLSPEQMRFWNEMVKSAQEVEDA